MEFFFILVFAVTVVLGQEVLYERLWWKKLSARLEFGEEVLTEGEKGSIKEIIRNEKFLPIPALHVKWQVSRNLKFDTEANTAVTDMTYRNDIFSLMPYQQITRTLTFTAAKRGYFEGGRVELVSHDLFFTTSFSRQIFCKGSLYVYPAPVEAERLELVFDAFLGAYRARTRLYEDNFALKGLREYQDFDPFNRINWKATARAGSLMVNEFEYAASRRTLILLNLEPDSVWPRQELQEESIRLCATLAQQLSDDEIPAAVADGGEDSGELQFSSGPVHMRRLMEHLCRLDPEKLSAHFENTVAALEEGLKEREGFWPFFVLISTSQSPQLQRAYRELVRLSPGSLWIAPLYPEDTMELTDCPEAEAVRWDIRRG